MTVDDVPAGLNVLNTTVLSNFAYVDQLWVGEALAELAVEETSEIDPVEAVRESRENG